HRVAEQQRGPVGRGEQESPAEAELEVGGDRETREDAAEGGRLAEDEGEDEGRVSRRVVEARSVADRREAAGEGREEEDRHQERRQQENRVAGQRPQQAPAEPRSS